MKKTPYSQWFAFLLFLISSCQMPPLIVLFNNSGRDITVYAEGRSYQVNKGATTEIQYPGNEQKMRIDNGVGSLEYKVLYPPPAYMSSRVFTAYVINCQIEADGFIYVLPSPASMPAKDLLPQPAGFPLKPIRYTRNGIGKGVGL